MTKTQMTTNLPAAPKGWVLDLPNGQRQFMQTTSRTIAFHYARKLNAVSARMYAEINGVRYIEV